MFNILSHVRRTLCVILDGNYISLYTQVFNISTILYTLIIYLIQLDIKQFSTTKMLIEYTLII